jgi:GT2 family glycosyltransferase
VQPQSLSEQESAAEPRVTVILVSWNCVDSLRRCLGALSASKGRERFEVQVVDVGSRDGCAQADAEFPGVAVQRLPRNFGRSRARNIALKTARSELVLFLDPEVEVAPETVGALADALDGDALTVAAVPRLVSVSGEPLGLGGPLPTSKELAAACRENRGLTLGEAAAAVVVAPGATLMVRTSFLRGMNYLDEKRFTEYWAELELFWQVHNAGKRVIVVETPATWHEPLLSVALGRSEQALQVADRVAGAAAYLGKHAGFGTRVGFVAGQFFGALGAALREPGYGLSLAYGILTGRRIDGTQGGVLG